MLPYVLALTPEPELLPELQGSPAGSFIVAESSLSRGLERLNGERCSLVILDTAYEETLVLDLVERLTNAGHRVAVLARETGESLLRAATARGAAAVLTFPLQVQPLLALLAQEETPAPGLDLAAHSVLGRNPALVSAFDVAARVAATSATVLIQGESGTGKELLAQFLHACSPRASRPFVAVNCAAIPEGLLESELFGYEKGAFTGAVNRHIGRFERASGGTLFLDEVAEMSPPMQAKLLRVLQERTVDRVGGKQAIHVDARIVTATNRDLAEEVAAGRFREDLYYRLAVIPLRLPALRERLDDLPLLAQHFVQRFAQEHARPVRTLAPDALARLRSYDWPGNVRQLQNTLERAVLLAEGAVLRAEHVQLPLTARRDTPAEMTTRQPADAGEPLLPLEEMERRHITRALELTGGHLGGAAQLLGIHRNTLRRKLQSYGWRDINLQQAEDTGETPGPPMPVQVLLRHAVRRATATAALRVD